jgi:CubicO group peptidase (beta-lactamase class C family)
MHSISSARTALALILLGSAFAAMAQSDAVDAYVEAERERQRIPGLSIAVVRDGQLVKARGYGLANVELEVPASEHTIYQSGSVGKQFTATLVMMLVEEHELALDDTLAELVTGAPPAWRDVTVRHLLSHTGGLSNQVYEKIDLRRDYTDEDLTRAIAELPLDFVPGTRFSYSNSGYVMLGVAIRRKTGSFYGDLLREKVLGPAGMTTARVINEADIVPNRAAGYRLVDGNLKNQEWVSPTLNTTADGALYLTALDLAKWDSALDTERLLPRDALDLMWTPTKLNDGTTENYGFGWALGELAGHRVVQHGGVWQGFGSYIARYIDDRLTVIVLTNLAQADPGRIARGIAGHYEPELAPPVRTAIDVDPKLFDDYVGRYEFAPGEGLAIELADGALIARPMGQSPARLLAMSETRFFVDVSDVEFEFVKDANGSVTHLVLHTPGGAPQAKKVN